MHYLQELIRNLNKSEKKTVRKFLAAYSNNGRADTLGLKLFDLLDKRKKVLSNKDCSIELYGSDQKNRLRVIKSRIKQRIFDGLLTDIVIENQNHDDVTKVSIQLKKKLIQFQSLYYSKRQNLKIVVSLLDEVIVRSEKYELYSILAEALNLKKLVIGYRSGLGIYEYYEQKAKHAGLCSEINASIINNLYKMQLLEREKGARGELLTFVKKAIAEGEKQLTRSKSVVGSYYLNSIKYNYFILIKNHLAANEVMKDQIDVIKSSLAVYRKGRMGAAYDYLSVNNLRLGNYDAALEYAEKGRAHFKPGELNHAVAQELCFRACIYANRLSEAEKIINEMLRIYKDDDNKHRLAMHKYFKAVLFFAKGEFAKCSKQLSLLYEFKKDKTGWEFNLRALQMMCLIEMDKLEMANDKYERWMRILSTFKKNEHYTDKDRNAIIRKLLKKLIDSVNNKERLKKLNNSTLYKQLLKPQNEWDPITAELIPFHTWIATKV